MTERTGELPPDEPDEAPEGFREQPRYASAVERAYANDRIEVTWEPGFCIHAAECLRGLPAVFDNRRRPWIIVDNGSPGDIGEVIQRCPTGALHFRRLDGGPQEPVPEATTMQERPNGPLYVRGNVTIFGQDHTLVRQDTRVALCRCGASANKPFCDGSHRRVGFRTTPGPALAQVAPQVAMTQQMPPAALRSPSCRPVRARLPRGGAEDLGQAAPRPEPDAIRSPAGCTPCCASWSPVASPRRYPPIRPIRSWPRLGRAVS